MPDFGAWKPEDWSALAAATTTLIALVATAIAIIQVRQARKLREEQAQPFVIVDFEPSSASNIFLDLVIKNTGQTLARDVKITFEPPLKSAYYSSPGAPEQYDIMQAAIIREGIPTLPPGKEFRIHFERMPDRFTSDLPRSYTATVRFSSNRRVERPLIYRLDLDIYFGTRHLTIYGTHHIAKAVDETRKTLQRWTTHFNGLKVYAIDEAAYQEKLDQTYESLAAGVESVGTASSDFDAAITTGVTTTDDANDAEEDSNRTEAASTGPATP
jgi:hypothetical protein